MGFASKFWLKMFTMMFFFAAKERESTPHSPPPPLYGLCCRRRSSKPPLLPSTQHPSLSLPANPEPPSLPWSSLRRSSLLFWSDGRALLRPSSSTCRQPRRLLACWRSRTSLLPSPPSAHPRSWGFKVSSPDSELLNPRTDLNCGFRWNSRARKFRSGNVQFTHLNSY